MFYYISVYRTPKPKSDPGVNNAVVIVTTAPFQPLVIYPNGKKTGFDPQTGDKIIEIPKSKYYFEAGDQTPEPGSFWLGLTDTPDNFALHIMGENSEYYSFGFYTFKDGIQLSQTFSGKIVSANTVVYQAAKTPDGEFPWSLTLVK